MTVYVGMDVHRKRSQVAIVDQAGAVQRNRNVPNDPAGRRADPGAQQLRQGLLPEAWIAPQPVRDLRAPLRHRVSLVRSSIASKNRVHAVLADRGVREPTSLWTAAGRAWLATWSSHPCHDRSWTTAAG